MTLLNRTLHVEGAVIFEESAVLSETILFATLVVWCTNTLLPTLLGCALLPFTRFKAAVA
jgi:hypothetical protein